MWLEGDSAEKRPQGTPIEITGGGGDSIRTEVIWDYRNKKKKKKKRREEKKKKKKPQANV